MLTTRLKVMFNFFQQLEVSHHQMSAYVNVLVLALLRKWVLGIIRSKKYQAQLIFVFSKDLKGIKYYAQAVDVRKLIDIVTDN